MLELSGPNSIDGVIRGPFAVVVGVLRPAYDVYLHADVMSYERLPDVVRFSAPFKVVEAY